MSELKQPPLPLPTRTALGRNDYFVNETNAMAVVLIDSWRQWPNGKLVLAGPKGSGKTHLAHVWATATGARILSATDLPGSEIPELAVGAVCVEDVLAVAGDREAEEALFHLHNLCGAEGVPLMVTAEVPPAQWPLVLPDLKSRMEACQVARLRDPDDGLLAAVLAKLFADRQIVPAPDVIPYLVRRMPRSFAMAHEVVETLDGAAMASPKGVSRPLAARVLGTLAEWTEDGSE